VSLGPQLVATTRVLARSRRGKRSTAVAVEFRALWKDVAYVLVDRVKITGVLK
jgi:hypothetical protein